MDAVLQRHCARYIYAIPDGLRELTSDISREVLRVQPDQLYSFIADYLDALMITRENARVAARLVEHIIEISLTIVELLIRTGLTREQADEVAKVIQTAFRRYLRRKEEQQIEEVYHDHGDEEENFEEEFLEEEEFVEDEEDKFVGEVLALVEMDDEQRVNAAKIIKAAYKKFKKKQEEEKDLLYGMVDWRIAASHTISLYRHTGVSEWEANRAATLIKAAYKGYYTRRVMRKLLEKGLQEDAEDNEEELEQSISAGSEEDEEQKKSVRIDFGTVKPKVDFDYQTAEVELEPLPVPPLEVEELEEIE